MLALILLAAVAADPGPRFEVATPTPRFVVVNKVPTAPLVPSGRAPIGHTHTCANGHTWDHSVTASHNCPECGAFQNVQDPRPRLVTLPGAGFADGGCANGSCAAPGRVITGVGAVRGLSGGGRVFGGIFRRR